MRLWLVLFYCTRRQDRETAKSGVPKMKDIMLIDGYNFVYAFPAIAKIKEQNLEHARDKLIDLLVNYSAFKGIKVILVFDAHFVPGQTSREKIKDVEVVFTEEGETADSYIERLTYSLVKKEQKVYVVTSDWAEQQVVLGAGAVRFSSRELGQEILMVKKEIEERIDRQRFCNNRQEIGNRLKAEIATKLDAMRKGRK